MSFAGEVKTKLINKDLSSFAVLNLFLLSDSREALVVTAWLITSYLAQSFDNVIGRLSWPFTANFPVLS